MNIHNKKYFNNTTKDYFSMLCQTGVLFQSQKTQDFCVAGFATLSDERRSRSKIFPLFIWIKEPCVRRFEGLERSKRLGISQTIFMGHPVEGL